jgi:hypothetical protein
MECALLSSIVDVGSKNVQWSPAGLFDDTMLIVSHMCLCFLLRVSCSGLLEQDKNAFCVMMTMATCVLWVYPESMASSHL